MIDCLTDWVDWIGVALLASLAGLTSMVWLDQMSNTLWFDAIWLRGSWHGFVDCIKWLVDWFTSFHSVSSTGLVELLRLTWFDVARLISLLYSHWFIDGFALTDDWYDWFVWLTRLIDYFELNCLDLMFDKLNCVDLTSACVNWRWIALTWFEFMRFSMIGMTDGI